jgi:hypothetical protein
MATMYLIKKAWSDSMENQVSNAFGYEPIGFVAELAVAERIVEKSRCLGSEFSWVLAYGLEPKKEYTFEPVRMLSHVEVEELTRDA